MFALSWVELIDLIWLTRMYLDDVETMINNHNVEPEAVTSVLQKADRIDDLHERLKTELQERKKTLM